MEQKFAKILAGYQTFRQKYVTSDQSIMQHLHTYGQSPGTMVVACCDSRVDPALLLQCDPGDLFVVRNVANIVPPYEKDEMHHGTSAALEFGIRVLKVQHLILLGHSQCSGIRVLLNKKNADVMNQGHNDFITNWVSIIDHPNCEGEDENEYAKKALHNSYQNCLSFPWIKNAVATGELKIHLWFFDIKDGCILRYEQENGYVAL